MDQNNPLLLTSLRLNPKDQKVDEDLYCTICREIVQSPQECQKCSKLFCKQCIGDWLKYKKQKVCPNKCQPTDFVKPHRKYLSLLGQITYSCINEAEGCKELVTSENIAIHQKHECQFRKIIPKEEEKQESNKYNYPQIDIQQQESNKYNYPQSDVEQQDLNYSNYPQSDLQGRWFWEDDLGDLKPYDQNVQCILEDAYLKKKKSIKFTVRSIPYQLNLQNTSSVEELEDRIPVDDQEQQEFEQINLQSNFVRSVLRIPKNVQSQGEHKQKQSENDKANQEPQDIYWFFMGETQKFYRYPRDLEKYFTKNDSEKLFKFQIQRRPYTIINDNENYLQVNDETGKIRSVLKVKRENLYNNIIWVFNKDGDQYLQYNQKNNQQIEDAYQQYLQKKESIVTLKFNEEEFKFDFNKMVVGDVKSKYLSISRIHIN